MVEVRPDVDDEDHEEEDEPAREGAEAACEAALVEEEADRDGPDDLREPVDEVVERASADVEQRAVVVVELCRAKGQASGVRRQVCALQSHEPGEVLTPCVEPVRCEEHGEEEDDHGVGLQRDVEPVELGPPGGLARRGDFCAVGADHLVRISHEHRNGHADEGQHEETDLGKQSEHASRVTIK